MKLNQIPRAFELCFNSNVTPALVGTSGVGKTSICKQVAKKMGFERVIVLRPSLIADVGDLVGLPDFTEIYDTSGETTKRTTFNAPDWLPSSGEKCLIVIDEINRTQKDIVMAMFDLIEAEHPKIGKYELPTGCKVVATLNPPTDNYTVLDFRDSAFTSRLCFIKVVPNQKVFTDWGRETGEVGSAMLDFLAKNDKFFGLGENFEVDDFFGSNEQERGEHVKNNNRSKKKCSDLYEKGTELGIAKGIISECIRGIAGLEFTSAFMDFARNYKNIITIDDLMKEKDAYQNFDYTAMSNVAKVLDDLKAYIKEGKVKKKHTENLVNFLDNIPLDTFKGFVEFAANVSGEDEESNRISEFAENIMEYEKLENKLDYMIEAQNESAEETQE